jgi:hypothetical protein
MAIGSLLHDLQNLVRKCIVDWDDHTATGFELIDFKGYGIPVGPAVARIPSNGWAVRFS